MTIEDKPVPVTNLLRKHDRRRRSRSKTKQLSSNDFRGQCTEIELLQSLFIGLERTKNKILNLLLHLKGDLWPPLALNNKHTFCVCGKRYLCIYLSMLCPCTQYRVEKTQGKRSKENGG